MIAASAVIAAAWGVDVAVGARAPSPDSAIVVCVADRAAASPLDTVELRAFAEPLDPATRIASGTAADGWRVASYRWSVPRGRVVGRGARVHWLPTGAPLGPLTAAVAVALPRGAVGRCTVRVTVVPPGGDLGGMLQTHTALLPGRPETPGFGLYSYFLMPAPPDSAGRRRVMLALAEYVRLTQDLAAVQPTAAEQRHVNANYLPLTRAVPVQMPDSILRYYDYGAAQRLLMRLPGVRADGLYLVSVPATPLSMRDSLMPPYIEQNLTAVPEPVVAPMVGFFLRLADQERFDGGSALQRVVVKARTAVGIVALGLPAVVHSMGEWRDMWARWVKVPP